MRATRLLVVALLLLVGVGAGLLTRDVQRQIDDLNGAEAALNERLDRMLTSAGELTTAQAAYVAPGQPDGPWVDRFAATFQSLIDDVAALRPRARSTDAPAALNAVSEGIGTLRKIDASIRASVDAEEDLVASDLIFSEARGVIEQMTVQLRQLRGAERASYAADRATLADQTWMTIGVAAGVWLAGLLFLVRVPKARPAIDALATADTVGRPEPAAAAATMPTSSSSEPAMEIDLPARVAPPFGPNVAEPATAATPSIDLAGAADLCTDIARMTATAELPALLTRAATLLDAAGLIVWMSAGEELFAVSAHGYDTRVISRLGPINRYADNITALAWRAGELKSVAADATSNGAIVAPMFGADTCIGVLAVEVRNGRESHPDWQAVATLIAAQLSTVVAAWPAASELRGTGTHS